ncbi:lactonase family protein [Bacillus sp. Marseille-P3661]|uniref:lactonase family protein n=1 Tax=Bacillus sp. Marseille-P3661 TaxID=1936234 RepID=UPI0021553FE9|nr:lactonase family protein [Bacillus sp. Marseille-P3661]
MLTESLGSQFCTDNKVYMYVGSWQNTHGGNDGGGGIKVFEVNQKDGSFNLIATYADNMAVGSMAIASNKQVLYAVNETKVYGGLESFGGSVSAFSIDPETGLLSHINTKPTIGAFPCSIDIDPSESHVVIANYGSEDSIVSSIKNKNDKYELLKIPDEASIVLIPLDTDGQLGDVIDLVKHTKISGVDSIRQSAPHPHSVNIDPSGSFVAVCDRGGDTITIYSLDKTVGKLSHISELKTSAGLGPRNVCFSSTFPYFYVSCELVPKAIALNFNRESGEIAEINVETTIPSNYKPKSPEDFYSCTHPSDIKVHPNDKFVYVLNRAHNSIASFTVNLSTGKISFNGTTPSQGNGPRTMSFDPTGNFMYVGNQASGNLIVYKVDPNNGNLVPTGFVGYANNVGAINFFSSSNLK